MARKMTTERQVIRELILEAVQEIVAEELAKLTISVDRDDDRVEVILRHDGRLVALGSARVK